MFAILVLVFAALMLLSALSEQGKTTVLVAHSRDVLAQIEHVVEGLSDAENGRRGFVISGQDRYLNHFSNGVERASLALSRLRQLTVGSATRSRDCDELEQLIVKRLSISTNSIVSRQTNALEVTEQTAFIEQGQAAMEPIRQLADRLRNQEATTLETRLATRNKSVRGAGGIAALICLIGIALFSVMLILLARANRQRQLAEESLRRTNLELEERVKRRTEELKVAHDELRHVNDTLERRIRERTQQLETANKELEAFSYSVSHDLRAPLRHIQGYAEMLGRSLNGQLSDKSQHYMKTIIDAGEEMGLLIDELLAFSRLGRAELREQSVNLETIVRDVRRDLELSINHREIAWRLESLHVVVGDPAALRQVMANLIGNAVKYTSKCDKAEISISSSVNADGMVVVSVADNGAGFDMKYADKLFGVFQRLHRPDEFEGTGIGLATVRRVVSRHGGQTWAESKVGAGATFYFTLKPAPNNGN